MKSEIRFWPGPYIKADPIWEIEVPKWIYYKFPDPSLIKIEKISQREDEMGLRIDLTINETINAIITFHSQFLDRSKHKNVPFIIQSKIILPIKEYYPVKWSYYDAMKKEFISVFRNNEWMKDENDPLVKSLRTIKYDEKTLKGHRSIVYHYYTGGGGYGAVLKTIINPKIMISYDPEIQSMVMEHHSCTKLIFKKNKKKIELGLQTRFWGIYELLIARFNGIISNLDSIKDHYDMK